MKNSFPACYLLKKEISRAVLHQTKYEKLEVTRALQTFYFKTLISLHQDSLVTEYHFFFGVIHLFYTSVSPSLCVPIAWSIKGLKWKPVPEGLYLFFGCFLRSKYWTNFGIYKYTIHDGARLYMQSVCPSKMPRKFLWKVVSFIRHTDRLHLHPIQWDSVFLAFPLGCIVSSLTNTREDTKGHEQSSPSLRINQGS